MTLPTAATGYLRYVMVRQRLASSRSTCNRNSRKIPTSRMAQALREVKPGWPDVLLRCGAHVRFAKLPFNELHMLGA